MYIVYMYTYIVRMHLHTSLPCALPTQAKGPDGQLVVNFDPVLHEVMEEAHHLSRPPLSMRMPPVIRSLMKGMNKEELRDRRAALELVMQTYRDIEAGMREEERVLLHSKLQQVKTVNTIHDTRYTCLPKPHTIEYRA